MSKLQRKTALSSFDLATIVGQLRQKLVNSKINAINSSRNAVVIKLHSPVTEEKPKLVITPQAIYTTKYEVTSSSSPSAFVEILRRELNGMHIQAITQVNFDRTLIIALQGHSRVGRLLILELFGKGNILLTDADYRIIAGQTPSKKSVYAVEPSPTVAQICEAASVQALKQSIDAAKSAHGQQNELRYVLANKYYIGGALASVVLRYCGLSAGIKCANPKIDVEVVFGYLQKLINALSTSLGGNSAYIYYYAEAAISVDASVPEDVKRSLRAAEIYPIDLNEIFGGLYAEECSEFVSSFVDAVDEYFNMLETAAAYQNMFELIETHSAKHDRLQTENTQKTSTLILEAEYLRFVGSTVMLNENFVDLLLEQLRAMFQCGVLTWNSIQHEINSQSFKIFQYVESVEVIRKEFSLFVKVSHEQLEALEYVSFSQVDALLEPDEESENERIPAEDPRHKMYSFQARLEDTATGIASALFDKAKEMERKAGRTVQHTDEAVSRIEKLNQLKIDKIMKETDEELTIFAKQRPQLWFEKFNWFFSSDGLLVLAGRDAESNEILVKRFMLDNDVFLHADVHGAACALIKAPRPNEYFVPPEATVKEAACETVTHSRLWDTRVSTQSYWVYGHEVSKTAPSGEFIGTGSFVIRGKRNFIDPSEMKLGISLLFRYNEAEDYFRAKEPQINDDLTKEGEKADEQTQYTIIQTKKAKEARETAVDSEKEQHKEDQKQKRKERQENIADMRFTAKLRRLKTEGRESEAEKALQERKVKTQEEPVERQDFCFLCGGSHNYLECSAEHVENAPSDDQSSQSFEGSEESISIQQESEDVQYQLLESAYVLSPLYKRDERPTICILIAPLDAIPPESSKLEITPGTTSKSQCTNVVKEYFAKQYEGDEFMLEQLKGIQDHQMVFSIPGGCSISGYGVGRLVQNVHVQKGRKNQRNEKSRPDDE